MWKCYVVLVNKMKQMDRHMSIVIVDVFVSVFVFVVIVIVLQIIMLLPFDIGLLLSCVFVYVMSFSIGSLVFLIIVDEIFIWFWLLWLIFFIVHHHCVPCDCCNDPPREVHPCLHLLSFGGFVWQPLFALAGLFTGLAWLLCQILNLKNNGQG